MKYNNVVVYTSENCTQCEKILSFLDKWEVPYEEKNVSSDRSAFKALQEQKIYGTPAIMIDNRTILGFQKNKLKQELGLETESAFAHLDRMYK